MCSRIRSLLKVWMDAVAEFLRVWRALMSWLRGNSIWTQDSHLQATPGLPSNAGSLHMCTGDPDRRADKATQAWGALDLQLTGCS